MAHQVLPQHRAHEQLRTEAPKQRTHSDKYVSAYVSSDNHIDMSFSNPILKESADHYRVGVDEFTLNLQHLSMLEYESTGSNVLFRIRRAVDLDELPDDNAVMPTPELLEACTFRINRAFTSWNDIKVRIDQICRTLNQYIDTTGLTATADGQADDFFYTIPPGLERVQRMNGASTNFVFADLDSGGRLRFNGTSIFWANFCIEIPEEKYRHLLLGDLKTRLRSVNAEATGQYVGINPVNGAIHVPYTGFENYYQAFDPQITDQNLADWRLDNFLTGNFLSLTGSIDCVRALDRRVGVEIGCSLPIKNSPMYDHGEESPDFVLGRYNFTNTYEMDIDTQTDSAELRQMIGTKRMQGAGDRICYHHLGPQQKIQALRLRLWARVRTFDVTTQKFGMQTIIYPARSSDFWFIKLHFVHKDSAAY